MRINKLECIKLGVLMGSGFCLYTIFMWLTKLDSTYLSVGKYFDMAIILLPLFIISWGIHQQNKLSNVTLLQRILIALLIGLVSFVIYDPFLYFYHNVVNPEWFSSVLALKEAELHEANINPDLIVEQLQRMKSSSVANASVFQLSSAIASVIVLPILISFISLIYIKKRAVQLSD